jgi:hypothetical protein
MTCPALDLIRNYNPSINRTLTNVISTTYAERLAA